MRKCMIFCLLFIFLSPVAWADVIATYKYKNGSMMTLVTRDEEHVRMDTSPNAYTLLTNGKIYSVFQNDDGQWTAMDLESSAKAAGGMGSLFGGLKAGDMEVRYQNTGKTEKVAGYSGRVYTMETLENGRVTREDEVVLCDHSDLKKVTQGWAAIGSQMTQAMGGSMSESYQDAFEEAKEAGYGAMLRIGQDMKLDKLQKRSLSLSYYELPKGIKMMNMGQMSGTSGQSRSQAGQVLQQDSKDVGEAAHDAAKESVIEEVREGVRGMFNSLFD